MSDSPIPAWPRWGILALLPALVVLLWGTTVRAQSPLTIVYGQTLTGAVVDRLGDEWVFAGCLDDEVTITMQSDEFGAFLELYGPTGRDSLAGASVEGPGAAARIVSFKLPVSGEYTIIAAGLSIQDRGPYTLTLEAPNVVYTAFNQLAGVLGDGATVSGTITSRLADQWAVHGCVQDVVTIEMESPDFTPYFEVIAPDAPDHLAEVIGIDDRATLTGLALPVSGDYLIAAAGAGIRDRGAYTLTYRVTGRATVTPTVTPTAAPPSATPPAPPPSHPR